jgi:propionate CoA-transferase
MSLVSQEEVQDIETEIEKRLAAVGKKVHMVVNYDNFYLAPDLTDDYVSVVRGLAERFYLGVTTPFATPCTRSSSGTSTLRRP